MTTRWWIVAALAATACSQAGTPKEPGPQTTPCTPATWWADGDVDGFGDPARATEACDPVTGFVGNADDCDDADADRFPGNAERCDGADQDCTDAADDGLPFTDWWPDGDGDGSGDATAEPTSTCDGPPQGAYADDAGDCDDADPDRFPGNPEVCDGLDQDCTGTADDGLTFTDWWPDADEDGHGDASAAPTSTCDGPGEGYVAVGDDCDDGDGGRFPGNVDVCDGLDQDCDPEVDEDIVTHTYWPDVDADAYGDDAATPVQTCGTPPYPSYAFFGGDCDDTDPTAFPGSFEVCDGADQDCDGLEDDGLPFDDSWPDADGDGWGDGAAPPASTCDGPPASFVAVAGDCDDTDPGRFPGNPEVCDALDQDCDGTADDGLPFVDYRPDADADGYADADAVATSTCDGPPPGLLAGADDCDDANPQVHPGADASECDFVPDTDCDGAVEEFVVGDAYASVQEAIDAASYAALVCVRAGTWGPAVVSGKTLTLRGEPGAILDGGGTGPVLTLSAAYGTEAGGFVVTGGSAASGAGVLVENSAEIWLHDLDIVGNTCTGSTCQGGGLYFVGSGLLSDVAVRDTLCAATGNALGCAARLNPAGSELEVAGLTVEDNVDTSTSGYVVYIDGGGTVVASDLRLERNTTPGTLLWNYYTDSVDLTRVAMVGNDARSGLILQAQFATSSVVARNVLVADNAFDDYAAYLNAVAGTVRTEQLTIAGNGGAWATVMVQGTAEMSNAILSDNATPDHVAPVVSGFLDVGWTDFWNTGAVTASATPIGVDGNIAVDPLLDVEHRLSPSSPAIDAGEPGTFDPDGSPADLGAYGGPDALW